MLRKFMPIFLILIIITGCVPGRAVIDWVDFVKFNGITYIRNNDAKYNPDYPIDVEIGEIKFNVSENVKRTSYKTKDGDAAFLKKGTKLYKLGGYNTDFRIVAKEGDKYLIYDADTNPNAKLGRDLLDIENMVSYIGINSETDGKTELAAIKDRARVKKLVDMILSARVDQSVRSADGERYFIDFHLKDGVNITKCFFVNSGELSRGIMLPEEFGQEIKRALNPKEYEKPEYFEKWRSIINKAYGQQDAAGLKRTLPKEIIDEALSYKTVSEYARPDGLYDVVKENNMVLIYSENPKNKDARVVDIMFVVPAEDDSGI